MKQIILNLVNAAQNVPVEEKYLEQYRENKLIPAMDMATKLADALFSIDDLRAMLKSIDENIEETENSLRMQEHITAIVNLSKDNPLIKVISGLSSLSEAESPEEMVFKMSESNRKGRELLRSIKEKRTKIARMLELAELEELTRG